jgi:hypothetical protein
MVYITYNQDLWVVRHQVSTFFGGIDTAELGRNRQELDGKDLGADAPLIVPLAEFQGVMG